MKVLVPVEDRLFGALICDFISTQSKWSDLSIKVLHVIPVIQSAFVWPSEVLAKEANELVDNVAACLRKHFKGSQIETQVETGNAAEVINKVAGTWKADAVVMGSTSKSGLGRWMVGSVSAEVAMHCQCPVYILRPGLATESITHGAAVPTESTHRHYLEEHIADRPFPLDGTDWSRLVSLRLEHEDRSECKNSACEDLLTRLHSIGTPLPHERKAIKQALHYWFLTGLKQYKPMPLGEQSDSGMHALEVLTTLKSDAALEEAERQWMKKRVKAWRLSPGGFWVADRGESSESAEQMSSSIAEVIKLPSAVDQGQKKEEVAHVEA